MNTKKEEEYSYSQEGIGKHTGHVMNRTRYVLELSTAVERVYLPNIPRR